jgi:RHS repeat-associated protein
MDDIPWSNKKSQKQSTDQFHATEKDSTDQSTQKNGVTPTTQLPAVNIPKGGGAIHGIGEQFQLNSVTGTASLSIPIPASRTRSDLSPNLMLRYDSGNGNSPFGFGWDVSHPSITRKTDKGLPKYDDVEDSDTFILTGTEDLLPVLTLHENGTWIKTDTEVCFSDIKYSIRKYCPRVEEAFTRIERWTRVFDGVIHWRTISRNNVTTLFGVDQSSKIFDPLNSSRIFTWLASESFDDKGNHMRYEYKAENSEGVDTETAHESFRTDISRSANRYLRSIKYGNLHSRLSEMYKYGAESWMFEVVFDYGDHDIDNPLPWSTQPWASRSDPYSTYRPTFELRTYRLCERILLFHHFPDEAHVGKNCVVLSLDLTYHATNKACPTESRLGSSIASFITSITQTHYERNGSTYSKKPYPPLEFTYTIAELSCESHDIDPTSLEDLPAGLEDLAFEFLDLDGEGISGILARVDDEIYHKPNLGDARFGPMKRLDFQPSLYSTPNKNQQWLDIVGDGHKSLVEFDGTYPGFYKRDSGYEPGWENFKPFLSLPIGVNWEDPNVTLIDVSGTGLADILIVNDQAFAYHRSLSEKGFAPPDFWTPPFDEDAGPRILLSDGVESVHLADMTADGLSDLVRIRNGEICYWPNLGYGRFGAKVIMDNAPWFDSTELFMQSSLRLADFDGSGATDIAYVGRKGIYLYRNLAGNSWGDETLLTALPLTTNMRSLQTIDLFGKGTSCLVWSSSLPSDYGRQMQYLDPFVEGKPYLLTSVENNLGVETHIEYSTSTQFYLSDRANEHPWATKLPFPVHVVSKVEKLDHINGNRFITQYTYHEGYYDGVEREFRGFGRVEMLDTESFTENYYDLDEHGTNFNPTFTSPQVLTKTWFSTGAFFEAESIMTHLEKSMWKEPGLSEREQSEITLPETQVPSSIRVGSQFTSYELSSEELRESYRALRGSVLRQEVYTLDGTEHQELPYTISQNNYAIDFLQPKAQNRYAMYFTHPKEMVEMRYERALFRNSNRYIADPRTSHTLNLVTDEYGNVLKSVDIAYGRRLNDEFPVSPSKGHDRQKMTLVTMTLQNFTNVVSALDSYRTPLKYQTLVFELLKFPCNRITDDLKVVPLARSSEILEIVDPLNSGKFDLPFEDYNGVGAVKDHVYRRKISHNRSIFRSNDLSHALSLGELEYKGILFEEYTEIFSQELAESTFIGENRLTEPTLVSALATAGAYTFDKHENSWWKPSGRFFYSPTEEVDELTYAQVHFYLPLRYRDSFYTESFNTESIIMYDKYDLLVMKSRDALGNLTTVGTRFLNGDDLIKKPAYDYRILLPLLIMDPNRNRTAFAYDILGNLTATALMGKPGTKEGDKLSGFTVDISESEMTAYLADPLGNAAAILGNTTTRYVYDIWRFFRTKRDENPQPIAASTLSREIHLFDLAGGHVTGIQQTFLYSDGFGRGIQSKILAEPESGSSDARWIASGWQIFNNKGSVVRVYEPFFTKASNYEPNQRVGVTSTTLYDPLQRVVGILYPNHTFSKTRFNAWYQEIWDKNDTVLLDPAEDDDIAGYVGRIPKEDYLPTWYQTRINGSMGPEEKSAAIKAAVNNNTPTKTFFDSMGRSIVVVSHNKLQRMDASQPLEEFYLDQRILDISGNLRQIIDRLGRIAEVASYDMIGAKLHNASMEAGQKWWLYSATGQQIYSCTSRGFQFATKYDQIQRPLTTSYRKECQKELIISRHVYGETAANPEAMNLRARLIETYDQASFKNFTAYDFKGNLLSTTTRYPQAYSSTIDWTETASVALTAEKYNISTTYDALNRPVTETQPDSSVVRTAYNIRSKVQKIDVNLNENSDWTPILADQMFNARGQQILSKHGNKANVRYEYDSYTFNLVRVVTTHSKQTFKLGSPSRDRNTRLQDLNYTYDAAENITHIRDDSQQRVFFRNTVVTPSSSYTYDALYRLIEATGREHLSHSSRTGTYGACEPFQGNIPGAEDSNALGRYTMSYFLDPEGNFLRIKNCSSDSSKPGWTRHYFYDEPSQIEPDRFSNRLTSTKVGDRTELYKYKGNAGVTGNITSMSHLSTMEWDFKDRLQMTAIQKMHVGNPADTYYTYGDDDVRSRKTTNWSNSNPKTKSIKSQRMYLGHYELYREYGHNGQNVTLERKTLHIMNGPQRLAMIDTRIIGESLGPAELFRYQYNDILVSSVVELDEEGDLISYEEYYPYGSTSYRAVRGQLSDPKRYRYTGKERDEESGFDYHGARYYASWIGRWISPDPIGAKDDLDLYVYVKCNPISKADPTGTQGDDQKKQGDQKQGQPSQPQTPSPAPTASPSSSNAPPPPSPVPAPTASPSSSGASPPPSPAPVPTASSPPSAAPPASGQGPEGGAVFLGKEKPPVSESPPMADRPLEYHGGRGMAPPPQPFHGPHEQSQGSESGPFSKRNLEHMASAPLGHLLLPGYSNGVPNLSGRFDLAPFHFLVPYSSPPKGQTSEQYKAETEQMQQDLRRFRPKTQQDDVISGVKSPLPLPGESTNTTGKPLDEALHPQAPALGLQLIFPTFTVPRPIDSSTRPHLY